MWITYPDRFAQLIWSLLSTSKTMLFFLKNVTISLPNGTTPDSCRVRSAHHSKPTSEQRITAPSSRPTSEQRNTAPSSKTDERAAEHRAIVEGRRTSSGSPCHRRLERIDSGLRSVERIQSLISPPIFDIPPINDQDRHYFARVSIVINVDFKNPIARRI